MLLAAQKSLRERLPYAKFVTQAKLTEAEHILYDFSGVSNRKGFRDKVRAKVLSFVSRKHRQKIGRFLNSYTASGTALMHVCGYCYGDQWGTASIERDLEVFRDAKDRGIRIILLPKTVGPFQSAMVREGMCEIYENVDLFLTRDRVSFEAMRTLAGNKKKIYLYPDYTGELPGVEDVRYEGLKGAVCIIPNSRIVHKLGIGAERYVSHLSGLAGRLKELEHKVFLMPHDTLDDLWLARAVNIKCGIPLVDETDPLTVKGIIRGCVGVISARLHGVISALSQGVPVVSIGWCHKYAETMQDYGVADWAVDANNLDESICRVQDLFSLAGKEKRIQMSRMLCANQRRISTLNNQMWDRIVQCISGERRRHSI